MEIGSILVDANDVYVYDDNILPLRTSWDKNLLKTLVSLGDISKKGYNLLPRSIKDVSKVCDVMPNVCVTIKEIDALADILFVTRVPPRRGYREVKKFRFDKFEPIVKTDTLEVWKRKVK